MQGSGPVAEALRELAPGRGGSEIAVDGLGGTVDGEPFYALVPLALVEVTGDAGERAFQGLGLHTARVLPSAVGVLPRIVCQVINECAFALGEGVGSAQDIDAGMVLGMNYPRGPLAWADALGREHVVATLGALWEEYREERYRLAPALRARRALRLGGLARASSSHARLKSTPVGAPARRRPRDRYSPPAAARRRRGPLRFGEIAHRHPRGRRAPAACRGCTTRRPAPPGSPSRGGDRLAVGVVDEVARGEHPGRLVRVERPSVTT